MNEFAVLDEAESRHLTTVLRKKEGEELYVFDGKGKLFEARVTAISKKDVTIRAVKLLQVDDAAKPRLHIAIAPPKNMDRLEWFAEKVTEIGVDEITPVICKHSERKDMRADRIEKILVSACKQSKKLTIPKLNGVMAFDELVVSVNNGVRKFIAYCDDKAIHLKDAYHGGFDALVLIGPEGDFTKEEVNRAEQNEFETVSLGKSRLRLETAGIYAATVFNIANER